jgi:hypothetical protein
MAMRDALQALTTVTTPPAAKPAEPKASEKK